MPSDQVVALAAAKHRLSQLETFMKETEGSAQPADNDD
jgi:hypothetical protein